MSEDRPPQRSKEEELMDALIDLRERLRRHKKDGKSDDDMLRRYDYFIKNSNVGRQCQYAQKCKMLFFTVDYLEVKELISQIHKLMEEVESE